MSTDTDIFIPFIREINPKVIFEFGTYDGEDALRYRKEFPDAKIYCFEPNPILYANALHNFEGFNIKLFDFAISDVVGQIQFYPSVLYKGMPGPSGSILKQSEYCKKSQESLQAFPGPIMVKCTTIDFFCGYHIREIDYMQVDVEGAVIHVLNGLGDIRPKMMRIEVYDRDKYFVDAPTKQECDELLFDMGYSILFEQYASSADVLYILK